jgi:hypothetical protein
MDILYIPWLYGNLQHPATNKLPIWIHLPNQAIDVLQAVARLFADLLDCRDGTNDSGFLSKQVPGRAFFG